MQTQRQGALNAFRQRFDVESRYGASAEIRSVAKHGLSVIEMIFALNLVSQRSDESGQSTREALSAIELTEALVLMVPEINDLISACNDALSKGSTPSSVKMFLDYLERNLK